MLQGFQPGALTAQLFTTLQQCVLDLLDLLLEENLVFLQLLTLYNQISTFFLNNFKSVRQAAAVILQTLKLAGHRNSLLAITLAQVGENGKTPIGFFLLAAHAGQFSEQMIKLLSRLLQLTAKALFLLSQIKEDIFACRQPGLFLGKDTALVLLVLTQALLFLDRNGEAPFAIGQLDSDLFLLPIKSLYFFRTEFQTAFNTLDLTGQMKHPGLALCRFLITLGMS